MPVLKALIVVTAVDEKKKKHRIYGGDRSKCPPIPKVGEDIKGSFGEGNVIEVEYLPHGTTELNCSTVLLHMTTYLEYTGM